MDQEAVFFPADLGKAFVLRNPGPKNNCWIPGRLCAFQAELMGAWLTIASQRSPRRGLVSIELLMGCRAESAGW